MAKVKERWTPTEQAILFLAMMVEEGCWIGLVLDTQLILRPKKIIKSKKK
jgi:hypothetical protein